MKTVLLLVTLLAVLVGCTDGGNVDNRPTRDHTTGRTADQARTYAAGGGNLSVGQPVHASGANR